LPTELHSSLGIVELAGLLARSEISPVEIVQDYISRIDHVNLKLNAFVTVSTDAALRAARIAEEEIRAGKYRGPLHGIPVAIKDIIDTSGIRTTYGSAIFRDNVPLRDATLASRLKDAGAIILGKTNTHEFAFGVTTNNPHYGPTRNPWDLDRIPGGSSGGSAAAVAASLCCSAVGTDTGGSIRIPSAFCGTVGFKPTYGRISTAGVYPLAPTMDHVGPITSSVQDAAIMLQISAGVDPSDPRSLTDPVPDFSREINCPIDGIRIITSPDLIPNLIDRQVESAYENAISKIEKLGGEILEKKIEIADQILPCSTTILLTEAATQHAELLRTNSDKYGVLVLNRLRTAQRITTEEYTKALRESEVIRQAIKELFQDADFLLTPSVQCLPPRINEDTVIVGSERLDVNSCCVRFMRLANITGMPAVVLPYGFSVEGLPLSIQLMGSKLSEVKLLNLAHVLEKATPELRNKKPDL
jgi:aspartyl-tRNA(Asn)/glutamyl-tRNA(Gln) amidotransferase subunit A